MFAVCIAAAVIHFNDWMKDHAWAVTCIMYVSCAGAIACSFVWLFTREPSNQSPGNQISPAVHVPISINVSPDLFQTVSQRPLPEARATERSATLHQQSEQTTPRLSIKEATLERLSAPNNAAYQEYG
jgi:hypothetical protein